MNHPTAKTLSQSLALAALLATVVLAACGQDRYAHRWNERMMAAGKMQDSGDLDRAQARYEELLESPPSEDARRDVLNELADIYESRGDWDRALAYYERVWSEPNDDEAGARALYRSGEVTARHLGDLDAGLAMKREVIERYSASVSAEFSVRDLAAHYHNRGDYEAMKAAFDELYDAVDGTPVADNILFVAGQTLESDAGDDAAALRYYQKLYTRYPDGGLADDGLWQAAMIYHARQDWPRARPLLERLANDVETSWFVGSYNSPWTNDARFELGLIEMLHLDDYPAAIAHFERYLADFPTSLERDDAAWNIVQAYRLMGDRERHLEAMAEFVEAYPESRYVRAAREHLAEGSAP